MRKIFALLAVLAISGAMFAACAADDDAPTATSVASGGTDLSGSAATTIGDDGASNSVTGAGSDSVTVALEAYGGADVSGSATFMIGDDGTRLVVKGAGADAVDAAHLHCFPEGIVVLLPGVAEGWPGPVSVDLTDPDVIDTPCASDLDSLLGRIDDGALYINVHRRGGGGATGWFER